MAQSRPIHGRFSFTLQELEEVELLATLLANHFPSAERARLGIWEWLVNAVKHGKQSIEVTLHASEDQVLISVEDSGRGFNWKQWLNLSDQPLRLHGRGLKMAEQLSFDEMRFNTAGNRIVGLMYRSDHAT